MSNNFHLQLYRGTTAQNNAYTGLAGEITADTQAGNIRLHDGSKAGGYVVASMPVGSIIPYAGTTIPDGYLLCDGSAISRTTYSALFASIGTTYGEGDGNSTFNIPIPNDFPCGYVNYSTATLIRNYQSEQILDVTKNGIYYAFVLFDDTTENKTIYLGSFESSRGRYGSNYNIATDSSCCGILPVNKNSKFQMTISSDPMETMLYFFEDKGTKCIIKY